MRYLLKYKQFNLGKYLLDATSNFIKIFYITQHNIELQWEIIIKAKHNYRNPFIVWSTRSKKAMKFNEYRYRPCLRIEKLISMRQHFPVKFIM